MAKAALRICSMPFEPSAPIAALETAVLETIKTGKYVAPIMPALPSVATEVPVSEPIYRIADPQTDLPVETLPVSVPAQPMPLVTPPEFVAVTDRKKKVKA